MQAFIINLLNTDFVLALVIGAFVSFIVKWLATAQGMQWKRWEGLAITAVKMAEVAIPDGTANKGAKRLDQALRIFLDKYEKATGVTPNEADVAEITSLLSLVHDRLDGAGTLAPQTPQAMGPGQAGFARVGAMLVLCLCSLAIVCGCMTRTRCLQQSFSGCTFNVNEPEATISDNAVPRSLQIGVQDQMVEGGSDSIASGNKTDPQLQIPMGDSALGAVGAWLGGLVKGAGKSESGVGSGTESGAACADGTCGEK